MLIKAPEIFHLTYFKRKDNSQGPILDKNQIKSNGSIFIYNGDYDFEIYTEKSGEDYLFFLNSLRKKIIKS